MKQKQLPCKAKTEQQDIRQDRKTFHVQGQPSQLVKTCNRDISYNSEAHMNPAFLIKTQYTDML